VDVRFPNVPGERRGDIQGKVNLRPILVDVYGGSARGCRGIGWHLLCASQIGAQLLSIIIITTAAEYDQRPGAYNHSQ
jgi:hypothetical protein